MRILLIGGSKSKKSNLAQDLCIKLSDKDSRFYWATMIPTDKEDDERILNHIEDRAGMSFKTIECGKNILKYKDKIQSSTVLFDSITAYLANEMFSQIRTDDNKTITERCSADLLNLSLISSNFVCVCDDLWHDGGKYDDLSKSYIKNLAMICRNLAKEFDTVCEVIAGHTNILKGELPG